MKLLIELGKKIEKIQLDNRNMIMVLLLCAIVIYFDIAFLASMQVKGLKELGPKIATLSKDIKDISNLQQLKKRQQSTKQGDPQKVKKIISEEEIPSLLQYISDVANKYQIRITQINAAKESKPEKGGKSKKGKEKSEAKEMPAAPAVLITLDLVSDYHTFGKFITDLENAEQFVVLEELKIVNDPNNCVQQIISLVLKTNVKK